MDDVHIDVEADQEGDAELEGNSGHAKTDPCESLPLLSTDLTAIMDRELHVFPVPIDIISQLVTTDTGDTGPPEADICHTQRRSSSRHTLINIETETDKNK